MYALDRKTERLSSMTRSIIDSYKMYRKKKKKVLEFIKKNTLISTRVECFLVSNGNSRTFQENRFIIRRCFNKIVFLILNLKMRFIRLNVPNENY